MYQAATVGNEISSVMYGISEEILNDVKGIEAALSTALKEDHFTVLDTVRHTFTPQGFTLAVLLAESHAVIHTYPEYHSLYFNIYSCRGENDGVRVFESMKEYLKPTDISMTTQEIPVKSGKIAL